MIRRATLAAALVLVASVVAAQTIYFPPPGGGPVTATLPWPIPVGGTGSDGSDLDTGGCIYFDGTRLRTIAASCASGAAITVSVGGVAVLATVTNLNFSSEFTVTPNGGVRVDVALKPTVSPTPTTTSTVATPTPHLDADITKVGDTCTSGACLPIDDSTTNIGVKDSIVFEGPVDAFAGVFAWTPTGPRLVTVPDASGNVVLGAQAPLEVDANGVMKLHSPTPTPTFTPSPQPTIGAVGDCVAPGHGGTCFKTDVAQNDCLSYGDDGAGSRIRVCPLDVADAPYEILWPFGSGTVAVSAVPPLALSLTTGAVSLVGGRILTRTTDTTVNTIAAETDLTSLSGVTVPIVGSTYRLHTAGTIQDQTGGGTATYRVRFGGSPVCDTGAFDPTGTGAIGYTLDVTLTVRQAGSSAVVQCGGVFTYDDATANLSSGHHVFTSNLTGIDLDGIPSIILKTTVQFSAASVNDTATERVAVFELVP